MNSSQNQFFYKAVVLEITKEGEKSFGSVKNKFQDVKIQYLDGPKKGQTTEIENGGQTSLSTSQMVSKGQTVIIQSQSTGQNTIYDSYRFTPIIFITLLFALLVLVIAKWKGLGSLVGLLISLAVIFLYIVPQILTGADPLQVSIFGSLVILFATTYLAHGISKQTTVALVSTFISLTLTAFFAWVFVAISHLSGFNEETATLQFGITSKINVQGLLLGGIIIGTLGALNDITTTQSAAVFELAQHTTNFSQLFKRGFAIGREHIVSMINTLVLAYVGSAFALFIFLAVNPLKLPLWVIINSEDISGEIVRTIAGSMGLILVVPIVTALAAYVALEFRKK